MICRHISLPSGESIREHDANVYKYLWITELDMSNTKMNENIKETYLKRLKFN